MSAQIPDTVHGYDPRELVSWLQKAIRRADEDDALWVTAELERSGFGAWTWARLRTIVSEDVGLSDPGVAAEIHALHETWVRFEKNRKHSGRLPLVHAVMLLCRAPKSRAVDWAVIAYFASEPEHREVPDHALDKHTARGKRLGRGWEEFFQRGTVLEPHAEQPGEAEYRAAAWRAVSDEPDDEGPAQLALEAS